MEAERGDLNRFVFTFQVSKLIESDPTALGWKEMTWSGLPRVKPFPTVPVQCLIDWILWVLVLLWVKNKTGFISSEGKARCRGYWQGKEKGNTMPNFEWL